MARKSFDDVKTSRLDEVIEEATQEAPEALTDQERLQAMKTQGHKGLKLPRINMAFTPDNYNYLKVMSRARGETLTEFCNFVLSQSLNVNRDLYEEAQATVERFIKDMK